MKTLYPELKVDAENFLLKTGLPPRTLELDFDIAVIGGGMAGICAAIAAARNGAKTVLIQDRSVLGGNASSEIRVCVCGASLKINNQTVLERETGIIEEILMANRLFNPQDSYPVWDHILYDFVTREPNLELLLNTQAVNAVMDGAKIKAAICRQTSTETEITVHAHTFVDCSGDGLLAASAGAAYRIGREAAAEFDESYATPTADSWQMGASLMMSTRDMGRPTPYIPPDFMIEFDENKFNRQIGNNLKEGYWWVELGSNDDIMADQELNRHKLMGYLHGVWNYIKNSGKYPEADNLALDWIGSVPGKRESRRFVGDFILSQKDIVNHRHFDDAIAFGGWPVDEHAPGGIENPEQPATRFHHHFSQVYQIPLRSLYSRDISNLLFAGRNISQTHIALASTRVMATGAVMGQAVGTAAAMCSKYNITPRTLGQSYIRELQTQLLRDDAFIPGHHPVDENDLARLAILSASSGNVNTLTDGFLRDEDNQCHHWESNGLPASIDLNWKTTVELSSVELKLDSSLHLPLWKVMKAGDASIKPYPHAGLPDTLIKTIELQLFVNDQWKAVALAENIHTRLVRLKFPSIATTAARLLIKDTYGYANARLFELRCYR
jgi:hypothetical protein